ncbi:UNVERIFIED_CONTAM: hypothetical protein PYX00_010433 [Menopon gallinae]|uniref:HYDIN/VesB/CFA65-like Ig-like domain-containing protein n=1 Tax=Menopon gallinae TaxID=328185 RepID=A0AAW2HFG3_9NEOP
MESLPLIAKSNIIPNLDVTHLIREIFQTEFETHVPSKKLSQNLRKSLEYEKLKEEGEEGKTFRSVNYLESLPSDKGKLLEYAENVLKAYSKHEEGLTKISKVELDIMETQAVYLNQEKMLRENAFLRDLLRLKRRPLMKSYNPDYVRQYRLLQGESGLPPLHEVEADFRLKDFKKWKKKLSNPEHDILSLTYINKPFEGQEAKTETKKSDAAKKKKLRPRRSIQTEEKRPPETFRAEPTGVCFTDYIPGEIYESRIRVKNVYTKPMKFLLKSPSAKSPFKVKVCGKRSSRVLPGLGFKLLVTFEPRSLDEEIDTAVLMIEDGSALPIPLASILEPPLLKTDIYLDERTRNKSERIQSSYIDCGACFPGDSKVTKLRFHSFGGAGEFFIMSQDNWINWHVDCLTSDNFTEIPPFRLYPTYFRLSKHQFVDFFVEFKPPSSGMHAENIVIACDNGELRNLDIIGDGMAWNRSFITFRECLEKDYCPTLNDDSHAQYYLDLGSIISTGKLEKCFTVSNVSGMPFDFRWEMRNMVLSFGSQQEPNKILRSELKIEPSCGVFQPFTTRTFEVSVNFTRKEIGQYRTVLSLYVTGLPYQSIEQASTIIRPSVIRGLFKSGSVFGEDDNYLVSPEHSRQDTYESIQEAMRSSSEAKAQLFADTMCVKHPEICAMPLPLKRSKTHSNVSDYCKCSPNKVTEPTENTKANECEEQRKRNITELGSDQLWDFVDVLVDEMEIWVEVQPTVVTLEPCILNVGDDILVNKPPVSYEVFVHNHNDAPITCKWIKVCGKEKSTSESSKTEINTIFTIDGTQKHCSTDEDMESYIRNFYAADEGEWEQSLPPSSTLSESISEYQIVCFAGHNTAAEQSPPSSANKFCEVSVEPEGLFTVQPKSRSQCYVSVSASEPGIISRILHLWVEVGDEKLQLYIIGKVPDQDITIFPRILDFGSRRRGTRYEKHFKIRNEGTEAIGWKVEQYRCDFEKEELIGPLDEDQQNNMKHQKGVLEAGECAVETYKLDARKPGLQTYLLKFEPTKSAYAKPRSKYMFVVGDVQTPKLTIQAPRFENAILAPSRTMYVGQMINQTIILKNMKSVATTFIWGNPFGCHCRKLRINMCPKFCVVGGMRKLAVEVNIMPLEEGIVEHCYIPCFFSRNVDPALLSIIGVVKDLQVIIEMTEENTAICGTEEPKGVFKITWPIKNFDPQIGLSNIMESRILDFECHCDEVDAEYQKKMSPALPPEIEEVQISVADEEEDMEGLFLPCEDEVQEENPTTCERKFYTPSRMMTLRKAVLRKKYGYIDEEAGEGEEEGEADEPGSSNDICRHQDIPLDIDMESKTTVAEYPRRECINLFYYAASEIQFLNVPYKTVAVKTFLIKNESPICTMFSVNVRYFGKCPYTSKTDSIVKIKNRVFGLEKEKFEDDLLHGQPLLITVSPSEGILRGWSSVTVSVFVYGTTWGEYRDFVICEVSGTPPFFMKVFVQLSGHPVLFPMFRTSILDVPVLRFNTIKYKTGVVERCIRVRNTSAIPITVTWLVFLTCPLEKGQKEEPFNLCLDFYTERESEDQEKATRSSRNYLSKNTSGSVPTMAMTGADDHSPSRLTGMDQVDDESGKKSHRLRYPDEAFSPMTELDSTKPEVQLLENFGKVDPHVFQLCPRELELEAYSEEKLTITFDPRQYEQTVRIQEFEAIATGCVRLRQEHAEYPEIYHRPCGKDYISKLLIMSAAVERPTLHFEFTHGDLRYVVNANDILKTENRTLKITKKYLVKNKCETDISVRLKLKPGVVFAVKKIETYRNIYKTIDRVLTFEPGTTMEIHLEATLSLDLAMELHLNPHGGTFASKSSEPVSEMDASLAVSGSDTVLSNTEKAPRSRSGDQFSDSGTEDDELQDYSLKMADSLNLREPYWKMDEPVTPPDNNMTVLYGELETPTEYGQELGKRRMPDIIREDLVFQQELTQQTISPAVLIYFPRLQVTPDVIDFGKVYLGETAQRSTFVTNLTQFAMEMRVLSTDEEEQINVYPNTAYLPAGDAKTEVTVEFTPTAPGEYKKLFRFYGNREMTFDSFGLTVLGAVSNPFRTRSPCNGRREEKRCSGFQHTFHHRRQMGLK